VDKPFSNDDWLYEMKLDGYRVEAVVRDGHVRLWTRNKQDAARYFPDLAEAKPTWINATTAIVDGEVVALNEDGLPDFSLLQDRTGMRGFASKRGERRPRQHAEKEEAEERPKARLAYFLFDLIYLDGQLLADVPLEERKKLLKISLREHAVVQYAKHFDGDGVEFYEAARKQGLEGIVAKLRRSRYEPGRRSKSWLKIKIRRDQELVVVGYEPGKGSAAELGALRVEGVEVLPGHLGGVVVPEHGQAEAFCLGGVGRAGVPADVMAAVTEVDGEAGQRDEVPVGRDRGEQDLHDPLFRHSVHVASAMLLL
jgi:bifunctional non-homologous end joining protein LigD